MKKLSYLWAIALLALAYQSCEDESVLQLEEEESVTEQSTVSNEYPSRTYVNMDDIPDVVGSLEKKIGNKASKSGRALGNKISAKDYEVYLDSIAQVVNAGTDTNYSFFLDVKGAAPNRFYNLIVGKTEEGAVKDPIVMEYTLPQEDMDYFMNGGTDLKRLNATYRYFNFERFFDNNYKLAAAGNTDCGTGYIGGGSGGPTIPPGGTVVTSNANGTVTTTFQFGNTTNGLYNFTITITDTNGNVTTSSGQASSQDLSSVFSTDFGQGDVQVNTYPPTTSAIHELYNTGQQQNTIFLGCGGSYLTDTWLLISCDQTDQGDSNKGAVSSKSTDCSVPEGTLATLTPFTLMILNNVSTHFGLNLGIPLDWSRYLWMSHHIVPETASINQFINQNGQSSEAIEFADTAQTAMMNGIELPPSCKSFKYQQGLENTQTAAVRNVSFRVRYIDPNTGNTLSSDVEFTQPIYFTIPRFHATEGNLTTGRGAELSAKALLSAHSRATGYFLATEATESQVRARLWEYIREEFSNGSYMTGGNASFTPPLGGFNGPITDYVTTTFFMDNCE